MIMAVHCYLDGCDKAAGGYSVEIPNPDRGWCKECHQQIGTITLIYHFCSPEHALKWLQEYIQSSEQDKEDRPSCWGMHGLTVCHLETCNFIVSCKSLGYDDAKGAEV